MKDQIFTYRPGTPIIDFHCHPYSCAVVQTSSDNWRNWEQQGFFEAIAFKDDTLMNHTCPVDGIRGAYNLKLTWEIEQAIESGSYESGQEATEDLSLL